MIIRGIAAAAITIVLGAVLSGIMPLILPADRLEESAKAAGQLWPIVGVIVGIFVAVKHKKRMKQEERNRKEDKSIIEEN